MSAGARRRAAVEAQDASQRWPDLYLVGAAKAGTTSLWWYLDQHPDIFMSPIKEPHYFSQIRPSPRLAMFFPVVTEQDDYLRLFAAAAGQRVTGEASSSYLWAPEAAGRIHAAAPAARIVISLRDPVERAWSHYWNDAAEGFERRGFLRAVRDEMDRPGDWGSDAIYISAGFYADAVERFLGLFGADQVKVLFFELFVADPRGTMRDLFEWLGVEPSAAASMGLEPRNAFKRPRNTVTRRALGAFELRRRARQMVPGRFHGALRELLVTDGRKPEMDGAIRSLLRDLYAPDVERLSDVLGIIPPWGEPGV